MELRQAAKRGSLDGTYRQTRRRLNCRIELTVPRSHATVPHHKEELIFARTIFKPTQCRDTVSCGGMKQVQVDQFPTHVSLYS